MFNRMGIFLKSGFIPMSETAPGSLSCFLISDMSVEADESVVVHLPLLKLEKALAKYGVWSIKPQGESQEH